VNTGYVGHLSKPELLSGLVLAASLSTATGYNVRAAQAAWAAHGAQSTACSCCLRAMQARHLAHHTAGWSASAWPT